MSNYYTTISQALRVGALDEELALTAITRSSSQAFLDICLPMYKAYYDDRDDVSKKAENIRKLIEKL